MNLLIHDLAAAIEREACDDTGSSEQHEAPVVTTYELHRPIPRLEVATPDRSIRDHGSAYWR